MIARLVLGLASLALVIGGADHVDTRFGYKISPPKDWTAIPVKLDEGWLVAKFLSDKTYFYTEKGGGWTHEHKPELMAIAFIHAVTAKRGPEVEEEGDATVVTWRNRYKDYKDFLAQTYTGGGYYVSKEEERVHDGVRVTELEIKVEKLTYNGPKRIVTWIYHLDELDLALQFEVLENQYDKLSKLLDRTLRSFEEVVRTEPLPTEQRSAGGVVLTVSEMDELDPYERRVQRIEQTRRLHEQAIATLPDGWHHKEYGDVLVISRVDKKYDQKVADQANATLAWLAENFPFVGPEEYVRKPILRICENREEEYSYRRGGDNSWSGSSIEIVTNKLDDGALTSFGEVNRAVMQMWFQDRDRELYWAMPVWLEHGLAELLRNSYAKGKKLQFYKDLWNEDEVRQAVRDGVALRPRELMKLTKAELWQSNGSGFWTTIDQANSFVFWLVAGEGAKDKRSRDLLQSYLECLKLQIVEMKEQEPEVLKSADKPKTEAEEEERFRRQQESWKEDKREQRILEDVFFRTFGSWSDSDWEQYEKAYFKSAG